MFKSFAKIRHALNPGLHQSDLVSLIRGLSSKNLKANRIEAFKGLIQWLRLPISEKENPRTIRFKFLLQFLERNPEETKYLIEFFHDFTRRGFSIRLLSLTGVSENHNFFNEVKERLVRKLLPISSMENDLAEIFQLVFSEIGDAEWFEENHETILPALFHLFHTFDLSFHDLMLDLQDAMIIVTSQIASIGTHKEVRRRLESTNLAASHFIKLGRVVLSDQNKSQEILDEIFHCRDHLQRLRLSLELTGVSVDLIYQIEKLTSLLDRLESLVYLQTEKNLETRNILMAGFISHLIRVEIARSGVGEFVKAHMQLITRKVVERAGEKGDYYIANTREEKNHLFSAGAWAGVLTSFAALFKSLIGQQGFPSLIEALMFFSNYLIIFLLMQKWHLALSSKLPAFTAAALSKKLESFKTTRQVYEVVSEIQKIFRSQMIAAVGNIIWVVAVCILIDWIWFYVAGHHMFSPTEAFGVIHKHDLLRSGTVFYAFITGIFLWLSSILGGAVENWLVFINFPHMIKEGPLFNRLLPKKRLEELSKTVPGVLGSMAGNVVISGLLAFPNVLGKITGLPLDIRHVTLSTGSLTFAFNALNWDLRLWPLMVSMILSILVMGVLNFGVSFYCALKLAATSQGLENRHLKIILKFIFFKRSASTEYP